MSSEIPPTFNISVYVPEYWNNQNTGFNKTYADNHYLKFPVAQGTEYLKDIIVSGTATLATTSISNLTVSGKTISGNIDLVNNLSTLDMKSGSITNLTNINGQPYPQASGIDAVLGVGNQATNKTLNLNYTITQPTPLLVSKNTETNTISYNGYYLDESSSGKNIWLDLTNGLRSKQSGIPPYNTNYSTIMSNLLCITPSNLLIPTTSTDYNAMTLTNSTIHDFDTYGAEYYNDNTAFNHTITDPTYTATLTTNALNLITTGSSFLRNSITNLGMTITGSSASITNILTSSSIAISNGTASIVSSIVSNIPTFKSLTSTGGSSSVITPNSVYTYTTDGGATNYSRMTSNNLIVQGATNINYTIDASNCYINNATNSRYTALSSGGHSASGTSVQTAGQYLYMGGTSPDSTASSASACIITPTTYEFYLNNNARTLNYATLSTTSTGVSMSVRGGTTTQQTVVSTGYHTSTTTNTYQVRIDNDLDLFTTSTVANAKAFLFLNGSNTGTGTVGAVGMIFRRNKLASLGDYIGMTRYMMATFGESVSNTFTEFGRVSSYVSKALGAGQNCGNLLFQTRNYSVLTNMLELNGDTQEVDVFKHIDLNGNRLITSSANIFIDADTYNINPSGSVALNGKPVVVTGTGATATSVGGIKFNATNITSATAGGVSGQHLILNINGTAYKIQLLHV